MMFVGIATLMYTPRVLPSIPRYIIADLVQESMSQVELPTSNSNKKHHQKNRDPTAKRKKVKYDQQRALDSIMQD